MKGHRNVAAVLEWVIALIYFFYVLGFFIDFIPAVHTKNHQSRETEMDMAMEGGQGSSGNTRLYPDEGSTVGMNSTNGYAHGANCYSNGNINDEYASNRASGYMSSSGTNGGTYYPDGHPPQPVQPVVPSWNF